MFVFAPAFNSYSIISWNPFFTAVYKQDVDKSILLFEES